MQDSTLNFHFVISEERILHYGKCHGIKSVHALFQKLNEDAPKEKRIHIKTVYHSINSPRWTSRVLNLIAELMSVPPHCLLSYIPAEEESE